MTTSPIVASENRLRPAFVATLVAITFVVGIAAGFVLSQVAAVHSGAAVTVGVLPQAGVDMSSAAYAAQHSIAIAAPAKAGTDMSAAAYAAQHSTVISLPRRELTCPPGHMTQGIRPPLICREPPTMRWAATEAPGGVQIATPLRGRARTS